MKGLLASASAVLTAVALMTGCGTGQNEIDYTVAEHYFFNNSAEEPENPIVTNQSDFDALYGYAPVMGEDGSPTPIDFETQFVIGIVLPVTNTLTIITPGRLLSDGKNMTLEYGVEYKDKDMSWYMRPMALIIVDRQYLPETCVLKQIQPDESGQKK